MNKKKILVRDTKLARKVHKVLESKDGWLTVEVPATKGAFETAILAKIREALNNIYAKG
jgi:hypothetical protein